MRYNRIVNLADCTEYRQTLLVRPPRLLHGTIVLLTALLGTALAWTALTKADLVVRAPGRVRPVLAPTKIVNAGRGEVFSASSGGRVVEVNFREGQTMHRGDVLLRLDTGRLDNEIARRRGAIRASEEEFAKLTRLEALAARQFEASKAKAEAELAQAWEEVRQAKARQNAEVRLAALELQGAADEEGRLRKLVSSRAAAEADLVKATVRRREAEERLAKARLPVDASRVTVSRRALELAEKEFVVRREELGVKRGLKQAEIEAARIELSNLELERQQATLRAPIDGIVISGDVRVGDVLETGKPVVEMAEQDGFRFEVTVASEDVAPLRVGMPARMRLDAYDYQRYGTLEGTVDFISPDSGVSEGQRTAVYLIKITIARKEVGRGDRRGPVKLGMTGQAEIVTGRESLLVLLLKKVRQTISLE